MAPLRILVADDTVINRQILTVFLKKLGHSVEQAENGAQAVERFDPQAIDLVVMDVMMPVMSGYEATRRIKEMSGERWVPVVFLSALDKDENLVAGLEAGGDDYLSKPVNFVVLEAKLRSLARSLQLRRQLEDARRFSQAVTDNLLDAIITIDVGGVIATINPAACRMFGYTTAELVGQNVSLLMHEPVRSQHDGYIARFLDGGEARIVGKASRDVQGRRKDGSSIDLTLAVSEFGDQGRRMFVGALTDISEKKAQERRLQLYHDEREEENRLALEIFDQLMRRPGLADPALRYWMNPAGNFSGDIVAAARASDGCFYVMLADATGHGLGAAISVLPVLTLFYDIAEFGLPLGRLIAKINGQLRNALPLGRFVSCACAVIDPSGGSSELWMGGMPNALLLDLAGRPVQEIPANNLPLGIVDLDWRDAATETLATPAGGGQLVLYSDGLIEARNPAGEEFGAARFVAALAAAPAAGRIDAVKDALVAHLGNQAPHDDVTLLLIDLPAP